jgi:hypothetical protein
MFKRPFTCIYKQSGATGVVTVDASTGQDNALAAAKEQLPGATIIAMVPGMHADYTYTYSDDVRCVVTEPPAAWPENITPGF